MGCFWGERNNNSYVSTHKTDRVCTADGKCYNYNDVFVDEVDPGYSNTCGQTCYVACSCNTSNGWYSSCQGSDCFSVTDTRYAGKPNAASASRSLSDIGSISASGVNSGISALASGATTCYKMKTCSEGGYFDSEPAGKKCTEVAYNGYTCYDTNCTNACPDGWFSADSRPVVTHMLFLESLNNPGCYQASCAPGYSTTVNGAVVAEYQGVKCYKEKESYWPTVMKLGVTSAGCDLNGQPEERMCYFRGGFTLRDDKGLAFADRTYEIIEVESFGGSDSMKEPVYYSYRYGPYVAHSAWAGINIGEMRVSDGKWFQYSGLRLNGKKVTGTREICISITSGSSSFNSKCINDWSNTPQTLKVVMKNTGTGQTKTITLRVEATVGDDTTTGGIGSGGMEIMPNQ